MNLKTSPHRNNINRQTLKGCVEWVIDHELFAKESMQLNNGGKLNDSLTYYK